MNEVIVRTPSRLAFTLIDMNGSLGRVDGSVGLTLDDPCFLIRVRRAKSGLIVDADASIRVEFGQRIDFVYGRMVERFRRFGVRVTIERSIPAHCGLGSGTQLSLALAHGIASLYELPLDRHEAPRLVKRGGTSGIGVAAFYEGGFIIDGGHRFPEQKSSFLPSSASGDVPPPPVLLRRNFPEDWPIILLTPEGNHVSGGREQNLFQRFCPVPASEVERLCRIILMEMLPALVEKNLAMFGDSINRIQTLGFKRLELEAQSDRVKTLLLELRKHGASGAGMTSWGPTLYAFTPDPERILSNIAGTRLTRASNCGAAIEAV